MSTSSPSPEASDTEQAAKPSLREDMLALTKFRLSLLVVITAVVGYIAGAGSNFSWAICVHLVLGVSCAAFASAIFNQLMEIEFDKRMKRTRERPLPANRIAPGVAMVLGVVIAAFGLLHLAGTVTKENPQPAYLAALTLGLYVFAYTPMKRKSSANTVVGAVVGAIPPVIGWTAAGHGYDLGALFWFGVLFFWQMPHFIAINWMYRDEYRNAGFVMWSNDDDSGKFSSKLAFWFSVALAAWMVLPGIFGLAAWWSAVVAVLLSLWLVWLSVVFIRTCERNDARKLFFATLIYLPVVLTALLLGWIN
ncbi:heme o synthase [Sulfuriroseicoccus oceanibius]|uniref:Protoheme IX farnesyltransferase n=1 Tax=Sulfuriroseicoccus oceanibius TaxID=2707525 RepID=A0A6B3LG08_9BACT|nr:heme o synthase [Sulfuriroseicoccus oceanibius]QQL44776.1 protoheme IX farnesyltransferase [Sulfuriroseicoccus oceanibius]